MKKHLTKLGFAVSLGAIFAVSSFVFAAATIPAACSTPGTCSDITSTFQAVASKTKMQFLGSNGTNFVALQAPAGQAADVTLTLPATAGNDGEVLKTDGNGNLNWTENGLRGKPVANNATLIALTAREYERRLVQVTKKEYIFKFTANLTEKENSDVANLADNAGNGKWIFQRDGLDHSLVEQKTGDKWIDGKDIYVKSISATSPAQNHGKYIDDVIIDTLIDTKLLIVRGDNVRMLINNLQDFQVYRSDGKVRIWLMDGAADSFKERPVTGLIYYTK